MYDKMNFYMAEMWPDFGLLPVVFLPFSRVPVSDNKESLELELIKRAEQLSGSETNSPFMRICSQIRARIFLKLQCIASLPLHPW